MARSRLNPHIWNPENKLREEVEDSIIGFVKTFFEKNEGISFKDIDDAFVSGPITNKSWNKYTSLDIILVIDYTKLDKFRSATEAILNNKIHQYNKESVTKVFGHKLNLFFRDVGISASGTEYSLKNESWTATARSHKSIDINYLRRNFSQFVYDINQLKHESDISKIKHMISKVSLLKEAGRTPSGRKFSNELFIYKKLQKKKWIKYLFHMLDASYKTMTINESVGDKIDRLLLEFYVKVNKKRHQNRNVIGSANKFQYAVAKMHRKDNRKNNKVEDLKRKKQGVSVLDESDVNKIKADYHITDLTPENPRNLGSTGIVIRYSPSLKVYYLIKQLSTKIRRKPVTSI